MYYSLFGFANCLGNEQKFGLKNIINLRGLIVKIVAIIIT